MPPASKLLAEEGAAIVSFKLVRGGEFQVPGFWGPVGRAGFVGNSRGVAFCCAHAAPAGCPCSKRHSHLLLPSYYKRAPRPTNAQTHNSTPTPRARRAQEAGITELLMAPAKLADRLPGCSGTRNLSDNLSDLRAQVAANTKGIGLVGELIREHGLRVVVAYMRFIQAAAEAAVREMLREFSERQVRRARARGGGRRRKAGAGGFGGAGLVGKAGRWRGWRGGLEEEGGNSNACSDTQHSETSTHMRNTDNNNTQQQQHPPPTQNIQQTHKTAQGLPPVGTVTTEDQLDDGAPIRLAVTIDRAAGSARFDFTGTGPEVYGNLNAPPAVAFSAVIYALRCMVRRDVPLNQGCLAPVEVVIPEGCLLNPSAEAAVVGGNVLTSQRVTDVVLKAFGAAAASQVCVLLCFARARARAFCLVFGALWARCGARCSAPSCPLSLVRPLGARKSARLALLRLSPLTTPHHHDTNTTLKNTHTTTYNTQQNKHTTKTHLIHTTYNDTRAA